MEKKGEGEREEERGRGGGGGGGGGMWNNLMELWGKFVRHIIS